MQTTITTGTIIELTGEWNRGARFVVTAVEARTESLLVPDSYVYMVREGNEEVTERIFLSAIEQHVAAGLMAVV